MQQTPAHEKHNDTLLKSIPNNSVNLIEIGCSSGALGREFKKINPACLYDGVEIHPEYVELAKRYLDNVYLGNIEDFGDQFFQDNSSRDCWIFGDTLEHLKSPENVLRKIRSVIPSNGSVCSCIPNMQFWEIQARLSVGDLRYSDSGLLDRTHLRWFTRNTIIELFEGSGFKIVSGIPIEVHSPNAGKYLAAIKNMVIAVGGDLDSAMKDAEIYQFVLRAIPV